VGENAIGSIQWSIPENCPIDAKISQISRTQTEFCPKFCSTATGVDQKICSLQHSMAHPQNPQAIGAKFSQKSLHKPSYSQFCPKFRWHGNGGRSGKMQLAAFDGPFPKHPPYRPRRKNLAKISYASRIIANFVPNFVAMATGVSQGKMQLAAFDGASPKTPYRCKNLLCKPSYSPFCPKFRCHGNWGRSGKNAINSIRWPIPENPPIGAKISYANRVIAHFVPNFVAMATGVGRGKMQLAAFDGPSPKTPYRRKNLAKIFYASRVIAHFVPNFVAMATRDGPG